MQYIKEAKVSNILEIKDRGLGPIDAVRITGYGQTTVEAVYSGGYEIIPFVTPREWEFYEETDVTIHGFTARITKNNYELRDSDYFTNAVTETPEDSCMRKEGAENLYSALDTLSARDRDIIQAKADGQSNGQIRTEFGTSAGHIKKIQEKLQKELNK